MTKLEIQLILEKAYESNFMDSIEILTQANKEYIKSDFYKETKTSLAELYKQYYVYAQSQYSFASKAREFLNSIDSDELLEKIVNLITKLENNPEVQRILQIIAENFDVQSLGLQSEDLKKLIKQLKK